MSSEQPVQHVVLIPAYKPSNGLIDLLRDLASGPVPILLVDDGSGPEFRGIFQQAAQFPGVEVLRHAVNLGKGAALKTGINHALCAYPDLTGIVTADADGQHHPQDIQRVAAQQLQQPEALVMGARTFDDAVPLRSRFGNVLTRRLMAALIGTKLQDTQTGLRGIPAELAARLLRLEARGYEFELEMLIEARQSGVPVIEVPIRTIYEPGNQSSHFNPLLDSMKIYFVLLRFSSAGLLAALLDNLIFYLIWKRTGYILGAQVVARVVSVAVNYSMVRSRVFASREGHQVLLPKYLLLVVASGTASYLGIRFATARLHVTAMPAKIFIETLLFFVNFAIQRMFIFKGREAPVETPAPAGNNAGPRLYYWLIGAAFLALAGVEVYGFRTSNLLAQEIWFPEGRTRLLQTASVFAAVATGLLILVPWSFAGAAALLLAAATVVCLGPLPCLAVAFYLLSAWSLGRLLVRRLRMPHPLSVLLGASVYIFVMPFAARLPVNYGWTYALVLALPVLANLAEVRREIPSILRLPATCELRAWGQRAAAAALVFVLLTHWFAMLKPEASADGLSMHLAVPTNIAANHVMTFDPGRIVWAVMPMGADFTYTLVYLLGGEMAARLLNFTILLLLLGLLHAAIRRFVPAGASLLLVTLFATTPMVQLVTGSLFVENLLAALLLGAITAIWLYGETGEAALLFVAATLGGSAMATKFGAIAFLVPALVCCAVELWHRRNAHVLPPAHAGQTIPDADALPRGSLRLKAGSALVLLLVCAAPPYVIAWAKTGNPVFPFRNDQFHSPQLSPKAEIRDDRFRKPLTWHTPYDLTFRSNRLYEGQDGSFGFQYLIVAPLALLALLVSPRRQAVIAASVAMTAILLILNSEPNARYLYPALPMLMVPFAALCGWSLAHHRPLARVLLAFAVLAGAVNVYFLPASSYYHKDLYGPFSNAQREDYLGITAPIRKVISWFNRAHPQAAVLLTQDSYIAGLGGDVYENHWHQYNTLERLRGAQNIAGVRSTLDSWNVKYLIARRPTATSYARPLALRELLDQCTIPEYAFGEFYMAHLEPVCRAAAVPRDPLITVTPGTYDDLDPAILLHGDWDRNDEFEDAYHHTVSYTDIAGADIRFAFQGNELEYLFAKAPNRGIAAVTIDGIDKGRIDLYSPKVEWNSIARFDYLGPGRHLLIIRVTGESRAESTGKFVDVDCLRVK
ncbi:MAG: glycosyltransferase [Candidatus Solibacter sp.]